LVTDDICGGQKILQRTFVNQSREVNKTIDIEGTKPQAAGPKWHKSARVVDPLNPVYNLPSFYPLPTQDTKFIRDSMSVDDIDTRKQSPYLQTRNIMNTNDISGAASSIRHKARYDQTDSLKVEDINDKNRNKSTRSTNPLEPVYTYKADAA